MAWAYWVLAFALVTAAVTDICTKKIPNYVTYTTAAVGLVGHALLGGPWGDPHGSLGLSGSLIGLAAGFVPMLLVWKMGGIGGGDAKMMGVVGALAGWKFVLPALACTLLVALLMALAVMVRRRIALATLGRVWRFLLLSLTPGKPADPSMPDSPTIAFGVAICVGSAMAMADRLLLGGRMIAHWVGT